MATPRYGRAAELVTQLKAGGITASRSVPDLLARLPGVLVPPPTLGPGAYGGPTTTWRLVAIARDPLGGEAAWAQLDELLDAVLDVLPVDQAQPIAYQLPGQTDPVAAYAITYTES